MNILIKINHPQVVVCLRDSSEKERDQTAWEDQNNLSVRLLGEIDELLRKNDLSVQDLEKVEVETEEKSFTSARIARVTAAGINFCLLN